MRFTPTINIITNDTCNVYVKDTSAYLPENMSAGKHQFKYSDTVSIDVLRHNKLQETIHRDFTFSDHSDNTPIKIPVNVDGWFSIVHIVLPSKKWFDEEFSKSDTSKLGLYHVVYYSDGKKIYKYLPKISESPEEVPLGEILDLNLNSRDYTVYYTEKDYVSICFLQECYINLCQQIFNKRGFSPCWNKNTVDSELVYKRDLVWMAINVIKYLTSLNQLSEVERIIEQINGCNGLCKSDTANKSNNSGCGCSK